MLSTGFMGAEDGDIPIGGTVAVFAEGPLGLMSRAWPAMEPNAE